MKSKLFRFVAGAGGVTGLLLVFVYQHLDPASSLFGVQNSSYRFLLNQIIRFLLNDALAIGLIYSLFLERSYIIFSLWVQILGIFLFLAPYLIIKIYVPHYNGPLISFLHRLVLNPTLMLLLIPAFYFQRRIKKHEVKSKDQE